MYLISNSNIFLEENNNFTIVSFNKIAVFFYQKLLRKYIDISIDMKNINFLFKFTYIYDNNKNCSFSFKYILYSL